MSRATAPGGYLEFQDYGCEIFLSGGTKLEGIIPEHPVSTYMYSTTSAVERAGHPLTVARGMGERMRKAGFVGVQEQIAIWPYGPWPKQRELKEIGRWGMLGMIETAYPFALQLLTREGWTQEQVKELVDAMTDSARRNNYYFQAWFVYGRKLVT